MMRFDSLVAVAIALLAGGVPLVGPTPRSATPGPRSTATTRSARSTRSRSPGPMRSMSSPAASRASPRSGGENLLDETEVVVEDGALKIRPKKRKSIRWNWGNDEARSRIDGQRRRAARRGDRRIGRDHGRPGRGGDFEGEVAGSGDLRARRGRRRQGRAGDRRVGRRQRRGQGRQASTYQHRRIGRRRRQGPRSRRPPTCRSPGRAMSAPTPPTPPTSRSWDRAMST